MNGYTPGLQLDELDREQIQQVIRDEKLYHAYVNALALIQDLIGEFAEKQEKPRFTPAQIDKQGKKLLDELAYINGRSFQIKTPSEALRETLGTNIKQNFAQAWAIRRRIESSETLDERHRAEQDATQFLNSLLQNYTTLRILKQNREPSQPQ